MFKTARKSKSMGLCILIILNLLFIPFYSSKAQNNKVSFTSVVNSMDFSIEEINVNAHVTMGDRFTDPTHALKMGEEISKDLGMADYVITDHSTWGNTQLVIHGINENGYDSTIIVQSTELSEIKETNIVLDMVANDIFELESMEDKTRNILNQYGSPTITSCITAAKESRLTMQEQKELVHGLMTALEASEAESYADSNMISMTGYSKKIKGWTQYGGNKVNLQIAMRYNSYEDKTTLWLGTPFITIGY